MIINKIAFGNNEEAYVENRIKPGFNIIYSQDNNKGKTIVIQSAMFALGNEPIFPASFLYKDYYHYIDLTLDDMSKLICCRYKDDFYLKHNDSIYLLNGVSELKRCFNKIGFSFPTILKDGRERIVDPILLYQLFFVGQDENKTSNITKSGFYNKNDFMEMIYSLKGVEIGLSEGLNENDLKKEISTLQSKKNIILKEQEIFNLKNESSAISSMSIDKQVLNEIKNKTEDITERIVVLSKERNRFITKYNKTKAVYDQLNSLKKRVDGAKLRCSDCGSYNIEYVSEDEGFNFDISDEVTRSDIEVTLKEKMDSYSEEIEKRTLKINEFQESMQNLLDSNKEIKYADVLYYAFMVNDHRDFDKELLNIENDIEKIHNDIVSSKKKASDVKEQKAAIKKELVEQMNAINKTIDPSSNNVLDVFTKQDTTYSGCEEAIYYLSRLYAIRKCLQHNYPLIMDHFRAGELSSKKEKIVLDLFGNLPNQIIFTVTLKDEENNKYTGMNNINSIDYNSNKSNHILNSKYSEDFAKLLLELKIQM